VRVRLNLRPGQRGTRRLVAEYGERLVCVRYRYDLRARRRYKTLELIVNERAWEPPASLPVLVRINWDEAALRATVREAGGTWIYRRKLWRLRYDAALRLGLEERIVEPGDRR
jgi:hypothetical protein